MIPGLYAHVAVGAAALAIGFTGGWKTQGWRLGNELNGLKEQHASESNKALAETRARETALNQRLQDAQNAATQRETKLRGDVASARRTTDGLRGTLYEFRASLPGASHSALVARADTAAELLGTCVNEYRSVAEAADRHAGDALMLQEAWPK